jgi:hypothetical protein
MIDALWLAVSGVEYARTVGNLFGPDEFVFEFYIDRHPCDDQPYIADLQVVGSGWRITEGSDRAD